MVREYKPKLVLYKHRQRWAVTARQGKHRRIQKVIVREDKPR